PAGLHRAAVERARSGPADRTDQPLPARPRADPDFAISGVRPVVRDGGDGRLAHPVQRRRGRLRAPAHPPLHRLRRRAVRGGLPRVPARMAGPAATPRPGPGHPALHPAGRRTGPVAVIGDVVGPGVAWVESFGDRPDATLYPDEEARLARAVAKRRNEYTTVR